jgi:hypothetical protein
MPKAELRQLWRTVVFPDPGPPEITKRFGLPKHIQASLGSILAICKSRDRIEQRRAEECTCAGVKS